MRKRLQNGEVVVASSTRTLPGHWLGYIWEGAIDVPACHLVATEATRTRPLARRVLLRPHVMLHFIQQVSICALPSRK